MYKEIELILKALLNLDKRMKELEWHFNIKDEENENWKIFFDIEQLLKEQK